MSPASSGSLEVEKYIGACLISQTRPKNTNVGSRDLFFSRLPGNYVNYDSRYCLQRCNDRWAGGMPLISFANHQRKKSERSLSPKQEEHNLTRLAVHTQGAPLILTKSFNRRKAQNHNNKSRSFQAKASKNETGVDAVSVTSDESSGSANSDNCLPRIIKPRKRRKKDRKPTINQDGFSTDSASPDIDNHQIFTSYNPFVYGLVPENLPLIKTLDDVSEAPKLHHRFEDVEEIEDGIDINGNQSTTICQCRYCDPSGQIWDVDRSCYSPFLTAPPISFLSRPQNTDCLVHQLSSLSLEEEKKTSLASPGDLEVSTEIVTSLNGHRDIEIKFFSSSSAESVRRILNKEDSVASDASVNNECKFES